MTYDSVTVNGERVCFFHIPTICLPSCCWFPQGLGKGGRGTRGKGTCTVSGYRSGCPFVTPPSLCFCHEGSPQGHGDPHIFTTTNGSAGCPPTPSRLPCRGGNLKDLRDNKSENACSGVSLPRERKERNIWGFCSDGYRFTTPPLRGYFVS